LPNIYKLINKLGAQIKYCADVDGIIFVIDSSDKLRLAIVQDELQTLMEENIIK
jgi:hypothetical protein